MEKIELNINNIFNELGKLHDAIPTELLKKDIVIVCNYNTFNIYKTAYCLKFGYSLPTDLNFMGIRFFVNKFTPDNVMQINYNPYWNQTKI
jgi:hypothetical protein